MKKVIVGLIAVLYLSILMPASFAATSDVEVTYGKSKIKLTLVDDFNDSVTESTQYGTVTVEDSTIILTSSTISDIYGITVPDSEKNKTLYAGVKYIALSITSASEDALWFCFQPQISGSDNKFLTPNAEDKVYLLDKTGVRSEVEWCNDDELVNARYAFTLPELFEGYVLIPVKAFASLNAWDTSIWQEGNHISSVGFHATPISGGTVDLEIDAMYVVSNLPAYEAAPTAEPSPTPEQTDTPKPSETAVKTAAPTAKTESDASHSNVVVIIVICAASVIIAGIIVFLVVKSRKK